MIGTGNGISVVQFAVNSLAAGDSLDFDACFPQIEDNKPYATSFQNTAIARAAETCAIPATVFTKGNWAVEFVFKPTFNPVQTTTHTLLLIPIDANNFYQLFYMSNGCLGLQVRSGGTNYTILDAVAVEINKSYAIMISGNGSVAKLCKNGNQIGSDTSYIEPVGALANIYLGCTDTGAGQANGGIYSNLRISSRARTLAEHVAAYATGLPLAVDEYTTCLMSMAGTLQPTVRGFGLWSKNGRFILQDPVAGQGFEVWDGSTRKVLIGRRSDNTIGAEFIDASIWASSFVTKLPTETKAYAELNTDGDLKIYDSTELRTWIDETAINWYRDGVKTAMLHSDPTVGTGFKDIVLSSELSTNGVRLEAASRAKVLVGSNSTQVIKLLCDSLIVDTVAEDATVTSSFMGDVNVFNNIDAGGDIWADGDINCAGPKTAVECTDNYGKRYVYAEEAAELLYHDRGRAQLINGEVTVQLDPIFLEVIEPDTPQTPWTFWTESYGENDVCVYEWGADYFKVRERNGGTNNGKFAWRFEANRKGYAGIRLMEVTKI